MKILRAAYLSLLCIACVACGSEDSAPANSNAPNNNSSSDGSCTKDDCGRCAADRAGIKICSFVATPTVSESVTIANYGSSDQNMNGYTLWDANALSNGSGEFTFQSTDTISAGGRLTISHTRLGFQINDSGETITLKDTTGTAIDQKSN